MRGLEAEIETQERGIEGSFQQTAQQEQCEGGEKEGEFAEDCLPFCGSNAVQVIVQMAAMADCDEIGRDKEHCLWHQEAEIPDYAADSF